MSVASVPFIGFSELPTQAQAAWVVLCGENRTAIWEWRDSWVVWSLGSWTCGADVKMTEEEIESFLTGTPGAVWWGFED